MREFPPKILTTYAVFLVDFAAIEFPVLCLKAAAGRAGCHRMEPVVLNRRENERE